MFGEALAGIGALSSMFGGNDGAEAGGQSQTQGFAALPQEFQSVWLNQYLPGLMRQFSRPTAYSKVGAPQTPFDSQELYNLQQQTPNQGIMPIGQMEPFNAMQQEALSGFGQNAEQIGASLSKYMNPYQQQVTDRTNRQIQGQADIARSNIMGQAAKSGGLGAFGGSALGTQLGALDRNTHGMMADFNANANLNNYNQAMGFRQQTLQDMLRSGTAIQGQNQSKLDLANNMESRKLAQLAQFLNAVPTSTVGNTVNPDKGTPNMFSQFGGGALAGAGLGHTFGLWGKDWNMGNNNKR